MPRCSSDRVRHDHTLNVWILSLQPSVASLLARPSVLTAGASPLLLICLSMVVIAFINHPDGIEWIYLFDGCLMRKSPGRGGGVPHPCHGMAWHRRSLATGERCLIPVPLHPQSLHTLDIIGVRSPAVCCLSIRLLFTGTYVSTAPYSATPTRYDVTHQHQHQHQHHRGSSFSHPLLV
ncbi:hypothetical protein BKA80DRAFT_278761 [Phyllosticta citrichinensis]